MDVEELLLRYNVPFVTSGKNVKRGNLNIQCPFCGGNDPSHHMGINPRNGFFACWRDRKHRGKTFAFLLAKAAGIPIREARRATGEEGTPSLEEQTFEEAISRLKDVSAGKNAPEEGKEEWIALPSRFRPIADQKAGVIAARRFVDYLVRQRRIPSKYVRHMCKRYHLHYSVSGPMKDRIVFPIYQGGKLVCWTGRSIHRDAEVRYLSLSNDQSLIPVKETIYNFDSAMDKDKEDRDVLFVVEGVMDAISLDYFSPHNFSAVGMFNMTVEDTQMSAMLDLIASYKYVVPMFDKKEVASALHFASVFQTSNVRILPYDDIYPEAADDPADIPYKVVPVFCRDVLARVSMQ